MAEIQRSALHGSKPRVTPIDDDPLAAMAAAADPLGVDGDVAWDDFLLGAHRGRREPVTPLSASWLAQRQVQEGYHEHVTGYLVMPERLESELDFREDAQFVTVPFGAEGQGPIDLVWHADIAGPIPVGAIGLWDVPAAPTAPRPDADGADTGV